MSNTGLGKNQKKGGNQSTELYVLQLLNRINTSITGSGPTTPLATEATLVSVLAAINNSNQDLEIILVRDGNGQIIQQISDLVTGTVTYKDVNGVVIPVPAAPLEYQDASAVLNLILAELLALNTTDFATETTLALLLTSSNLGSTETTLAALLVAFNNEDFAQEATLASLKVVTDIIEGHLDNVVIELGEINTNTTPIVGVATSLLVVVGAGAATVTAGKRTVTFFNSGNADTTVNGSTLAAGVGITYPELSNRDTYAAIPYDALTSELTITTVG